MKMKIILSIALFFMLVPPTLVLGQDVIVAPAAPVAPSASAAPGAPAVAAFFNNDNFLGVHVEDVTRENLNTYGLSGEPRGVAITRLVKGGPAESAGLREKDVILRFDGEPVSSVRKLNRLIDESSTGHTARLGIARGGAEQELSVKLGKRQSFVQTFENFQVTPFAGDLWHRNADEWRNQLEELSRNNPGGAYSFGVGTGRRIGVSTMTLEKQLAEYFGVANGVLVTSVSEGSPAAKAGIKAGDVLTEIDGEQIKGVGDVSRLVNKKEDGEVTLTAVRDKQRRSVKVTPERRQPETFRVTPGAITMPRIASAPRLPRVSVRAAPRVRPAIALRAISRPASIVAPRPLIMPIPHLRLTLPRMLRMKPDTAIERRVL